MARLQPPVAVAQASNENLNTPTRTGNKPLQFMVDPDFHREFKILAADKGKSMADLFLDMYDQYQK